MKRRDFLNSSLKVLPLAYLSLSYLTACGAKAGDYASSGSAPAGLPPSTGAATCSNGGQVTYLNPGHAHTTVSLSKAQVAAAAPGDYTLLSGSHSHTFNLTAVDFTTLQAGLTVNNKPESDGFNHGHLISIVCA